MIQTLNQGFVPSPYLLSSGVFSAPLVSLLTKLDFDSGNN